MQWSVPSTRDVPHRTDGPSGRAMLHKLVLSLSRASSTHSPLQHLGGMCQFPVMIHGSGSVCSLPQQLVWSTPSRNHSNMLQRKVLRSRNCQRVVAIVSPIHQKLLTTNRSERRKTGRQRKRASQLVLRGVHPNMQGVVFDQRPACATIRVSRRTVRAVCVLVT